MTRTKDETLRVAARAVPVGETALATADPRDIASAVLEAVGFFRLEEQRDAALAVVRDFRRKLATYQSVYPGDKELSRQLKACADLIANGGAC